MAGFGNKYSYEPDYATARDARIAEINEARRGGSLSELADEAFAGMDDEQIDAALRYALKAWRKKEKRTDII